MKSSIVCSLLVGAVVFAAASVKAQVQEKFTVSGTIMYQLADTTNNAGTVRMSRTKSVSFNNKRILDALNASAAYTDVNGTIPSGSWLTVDANSDEIWVTNKSGYAVNLTTAVDGSGNPFAKFDFSAANDVFSGHQVIPTQQAVYTDWSSAATLVIQDGAGTSITITGLAKFGTTLGKVSGSQQTESDSRTISGTGAASYQGSTGVSQGKGNGAGHGVVSISAS